MMPMTSSMVAALALKALALVERRATLAVDRQVLAETLRGRLRRVPVVPV